MVLGMSGFTRAGDVKVVPLALVEKAKTENFKVDVYTGASLGPEVDQYLAEAGAIRKRGPYQADSGIRNKINSGDIAYVDAHLSHNAELVRQASLVQSILPLSKRLLLQKKAYSFRQLQLVTLQFLYKRLTK